MNTAPPLLPVPIVVIAGGKSQRLQLNDYKRKWQLPFGNSSLLEHILNLATAVSENVVINSSREDEPLFSEYSYPVICDATSQGPLSGILSALTWSKDNGWPMVMTLPCDTPFISAKWLAHLYKQFKHEHHSAVISRYKGAIHPLCGIWSTHLALDLIEFLAGDQKKAVRRWANQHAQTIDYKTFEPNESASIDPFMNLNTIDEYQNALRLHEDFLAHLPDK